MRRQEIVLSICVFDSREGTIKNVIEEASHRNQTRAVEGIKVGNMIDLVGRLVQRQPCTLRVTGLEMQMRRDSTQVLYSAGQSLHEWNEKPERRSCKQNGRQLESRCILSVSLRMNLRRGQRRLRIHPHNNTINKSTETILNMAVLQRRESRSNFLGNGIVQQIKTSQDSIVDSRGRGSRPNKFRLKFNLCDEFISTDRINFTKIVDMQC